MSPESGASGARTPVCPQGYPAPDGCHFEFPALRPPQAEEIQGCCSLLLGKVLILSCSMCLLQARPDVPAKALQEAEAKYTFIGPAPRYFYAALRGESKRREFHRKCLGDLGLLRDFVASELKTEHALYNLQVNPCVWQHFARARIHFPEGAPAGGSRGGLSCNKPDLEGRGFTPWRFNLGKF